MHVISKHALAAFWLKNPGARVPLEAWYRLMKTSRFESFQAIKNSFRSVNLPTGRFRRLILRSPPSAFVCTLSMATRALSA